MKGQEILQINPPVTSHSGFWLMQSHYQLVSVQCHIATICQAHSLDAKY